MSCYSKINSNIFLSFSTVLSLQELCCRTIVRRMRSVYSIDTLPLPNPVKSHLKSYALTTTTSAICPNNNILVNTAKNITCKSHHNSKFSAKNNCSISWSREGGNVDYARWRQFRLARWELSLSFQRKHQTTAQRTYSRWKIIFINCTSMSSFSFLIFISSRISTAIRYRLVE